MRRPCVERILLPYIIILSFKLDLHHQSQRRALKYHGMGSQSEPRLEILTVTLGVT